MQKIYRNPYSLNKFDKPFEERLQQELARAEKKLISKEKDFVIDLSLGTLLFQIVNNHTLKTANYHERGFGLFVYFDQAFEAEKLKKFNTQEYSKEFEIISVNEVPIHYSDVGKDQKRLTELTIDLLTNIYELDIEIICVDTFEL